MHTTPSSNLLELTTGKINAVALRKLFLECGADDVGFVSLDHPDLAAERPHLEKAFPGVRSLASFVVKMHRDQIRSPARSIANSEFHHAGNDVDEIGRRILTLLESEGIRALCPPMGFPMEADRWMKERLWVVSHKPVAVAAGLGKMGIHRNVIHPRFGNFILLGTLLLGAELTEYGKPIDFNPCMNCKLCVAACPVGAIGADGSFHFSSCYTHNYREFMGGFVDWVEAIADSSDAKDYRRRVSESETVSVWQSLGFGPNYKAAYCMAVCPAGEDVIGAYRASKKQFTEEVLRPLQKKEESLYVLKGSDAEAHALQRYPHKRLRYVSSTLRPRSLATFLAGLPLSFQKVGARDLHATYHFRFRGEEAQDVTIQIDPDNVHVHPGHMGQPQLTVTCETRFWLSFLAGERSLLWGILRARIWFWGNPRWLLRFASCFPS